MPETELSRYLRFLRGLQERSGSRAVPFPGGTAFFHEQFPDSWTHNFLRVEAPPGAVTAEALAAQADALHSAQGQAHRRLWVGDEATGEALAPGFEALGWGVGREWIMVHRGTSPEVTEGLSVSRLSDEEVFPFWEELFRRMEHVRSEETARQLATRNLVLGRRLSVQHFGIRVDGRLVSACDLYPGEGLSDIQDVDTLEEHRGKGYARAMLQGVLRTAREQGLAPSFLSTDEEDWPKEFYGRLGFERIGRLYTFLKVPPKA
ncbi:GNAT family N-acetyltransferase [Hyalangium rubrum]|uniref:GNAT family N-acetyltransferase n=1 Tax=Hyalangium rubrum TaxID=3103134 RepID=A0ABU5GW90_9BACT|nr:GNAT family N-acetyltransferase [Hyalangium sp. s54d21]MDY7225114.1 GNAT family N-acetyltransferase [Hyalangium sp. s54d21]